LRANADGSKVTISDVAKVELGAQSYSFFKSRKRQSGNSGCSSTLAGSKRVKTAKAVRARMAELQKTMPAAINYSIPFDTAPFVEISIEKVVKTLLEAMVLVFLVMYLFLQKCATR
jgi:multidrug efflux pump